MSEAETLNDLFDHDGTFEAAVKAHLIGREIGVPVMTTRDEDDREGSFVVVQFLEGAANGHQVPKASSGTGQQEQDRFNGSLSVTIVTERGAYDITEHKRLAIAIRVAMLRGIIASSQHWSTPYLTLLQIDYAGQEKAVNADDNQDVTTQGWEVIYTIDTNAWPQPVGSV
jgi:hypothetical protein